MEELVKKLNSIPNSYFAFVAGIVTYAKKKPERLEKVMTFIDSSDSLTPSDVVKFVIGGIRSWCMYVRYVHELQHAIRLCKINKEIKL